MATSVKLTQVQSVIGPTDPDYSDHPGEYRLTTTFSDPLPATVNWDGAFLLIRIDVDPDNDSYEHVCTVGDLVAYLSDRAAAVSAGHVFYRIETWKLYYTDIEDMSDEALLQQNRTQYLVDDWENYTGGTWPKTFEQTYSS